jgi:hypothetical protein
MPRLLRIVSPTIACTGHPAAPSSPDGPGRRHTVYRSAFNSPESKTELDRVIADWLANGRRLSPAATPWWYRPGRTERGQGHASRTSQQWYSRRSAAAHV